MPLRCTSYGAPSRGKSSKYFYYYKCKHSKHNNISAIKAHKQFLNVCDLMSIPEKQIKEICKDCYISMEQEMKKNQNKALEKKRELEEIKQRLYAVEEKWFKDEINKDIMTGGILPSNHILTPTATVERLGINPNKSFE